MAKDDLPDVLEPARTVLYYRTLKKLSKRVDDNLRLAKTIGEYPNTAKRMRKQERSL